MVSIGLPAVVLGLAGLALHAVALTRQQETRLWLDHSHQVRAMISSIRTDFLQTESDSRAFVITRREDLLPPLAGGEKGLDSRINRLLALVEDNPVQVRRVAALKDLLPANFTSTATMAGKARSKAIQAPKAALLRGNQTMKPIHQMLQRLDQEEAQLERERSAANDRAKFWTRPGPLPSFSL
ncbi:MAG: CHASE3 domain-containing protein [Chthoniobacterales bacterium]